MVKTLIYENALACVRDISDFVLEGEAVVTFPRKRMRMENLLPEELEQKSNFVYWCPEDFPGDIAIEWDFWPIKEPGLCILFFCAAGRGGESLFSPALQPRTGEYHLYYDGDINAYHISYFRRWHPREIAFQVCNLRKSKGLHMVAQGADPIPSIPQSRPPYHMELIKLGGGIRFFINGLPILSYEDNGITHGAVLESGKIGFRQMAPLIAEYANLKVFRLDGDIPMHSVSNGDRPPF
jgi:hypothetical protein